MTIPVWPADLPRPNRAGYQAQLQDPRLARRRETGPPAYRPRYSAVAREVDLVVQLSRSQKATFDAFHADQVSFGSLPFRMPDPTTDGWSLLADDGTPILDDTGAPIVMAAEWLCIFGASMPSETIAGLEFVISFSVAVLP